MTKIFNYSLLLLFVFSCNLFFSQGISPNEIKNMKVNELTNKDIKAIKEEMNSKNMTMNELENIAIVNGMSASDFSILKVKIENYAPEVN